MDKTTFGPASTKRPALPAESRRTLPRDAMLHGKPRAWRRIKDFPHRPPDQTPKRTYLTVKPYLPLVYSDVGLSFRGMFQESGAITVLLGSMVFPYLHWKREALWLGVLLSLRVPCLPRIYFMSGQPMAMPFCQKETMNLRRPQGSRAQD